MQIKFVFDDGEETLCEALGKIEVSGVDYALFRDTENNTIYIYELAKTGKNSYELIQIKNKIEFKRVCEKLNDIFS